MDIKARLFFLAAAVGIFIGIAILSTDHEKVKSIQTSRCYW